MDVLNLDELSKQTRTITIKGQSHEVIDMTVEDFIETTKAIEEMEKKEKVSDVDEVVSAIGIISRRVPTLSVDELNKLSMEKLSLIMKFIQGQMDEEKAAKGEIKEDPKGKGAKVAKK